MGGRKPLSALKITFKDAFLHCGRALIRSVSGPEIRIDLSLYPTYGPVLADQIASVDALATDANEDEANRNQLY